MDQRNGDVVVVSSDAEFAACVIDLLRHVGIDAHVVASGEEALELARAGAPSCFVLDVGLVGLTGYAVCQELRRLYEEDLSIIFVSGERTDSADRVAGLLLGADDYIVKPFDHDEFRARIRRAIERVSHALGHREARTATVLPELTPRERDVLGLLAEGHDQATIAHELFISGTTVSTHIQRILSKLGVHSRAQAVAMAHLEKLIDISAAPGSIRTASAR